MRQLFLVTILALGVIATLGAQSGCPGCTTALPSLPADTVYLGAIPDGQAGVVYNQDISFRMPKTTTPVAAVDSTTPPGITINSIEILSVEGMPAGLSWEANQTVFPVASQTDGCIKICGTPTVSDSFVLLVKLKATILFFSQETSFPLTMYIAPGSTTNEGFAMANNTGCGSTEVIFENNILPQDGYTYTWDFGDSTTFEGPFPEPHLYDSPGTYIVDYELVIDTTGFLLNSVILQELDCVDQVGFGAPDVYLFITDTSGAEVYHSAITYNNISLPTTVPINLILQPGVNYVLQVWDEDGGLKGTDDKCGMVSFNMLSNGPIVSNGFAGILNISTPMTTLQYSDTVVVYALPEAPVLTGPAALTICSDEIPLQLESSSPEGNQWLLDGTPISGATDSVYLATETGVYQLMYTSELGCTAVSDSLEILVNTQPPVPVFSNNGKNFLAVFDTLSITSNYSLQWYLNGDAIPEANGFWYCSMESGNYSILITDTITGCSNEYALNVVYDPAFDCTVGAFDATGQSAFVSISPNPASSTLYITPSDRVQIMDLSVFDLSGRRVYSQIGQVSQGQYTLDCSNWANGSYLLTIRTQNGIESRLISILHP